MKFYVIHTKKDGSIVAEDMEFDTFTETENYLESIGSTYWEIGVNNNEFQKVMDEIQIDQ